MTLILLRITGISICFIIVMLGIILAWHGYLQGIDKVAILACLICTFFGIVGMIKLTTSRS